MSCGSGSGDQCFCLYGDFGLLLHLRRCSLWMVWDEQGSEKDLKSIVVFFMLRVSGSELQQSC